MCNACGMHSRLSNSQVSLAQSCSAPTCTSGRTGTCAECTAIQTVCNTHHVHRWWKQSSHCIAHSLLVQGRTQSANPLGCRDKSQDLCRHILNLHFAHFSYKCVIHRLEGCSWCNPMPACTCDCATHSAWVLSKWQPMRGQQKTCFTGPHMCKKAPVWTEISALSRLGGEHMTMPGKACTIVCCFGWDHSVLDEA